MSTPAPVPFQEEEPTILLFADRHEWADVVPLEQYEGVNPLAPILYSPVCECSYACLGGLDNDDGVWQIKTRRIIFVGS